MFSPKSTDINPLQLSSSDSSSFKLPETFLSQQDRDQSATVTSTGCLHLLLYRLAYREGRAGKMGCKASCSTKVPLSSPAACPRLAASSTASSALKAAETSTLHMHSFWVGFFHLMEHAQTCFLNCSQIQQRTHA